MLISAIRALENAGAKVKLTRTGGPRARWRARLSLRLDDVSAELAVDERPRAPYSHELAALRTSDVNAGIDAPRLLVAPFVGASAGDALVEAGYSWADGAGNFDIKIPGLRWRQRMTWRKPPPTRHGLPSGAGSTAMIRWLLCKAPLGGRIEPALLQRIAGVSQPRVSQVLQRLASQRLVRRDGRAYVLERVEPLLDAFLNHYGGPGGSERLAYSLASPSDFAARAAALMRSTRGHDGFAVSADVGADLVASWRKPTHTILYLRDAVMLDELGLVDASGPGDANVLLRLPTDPSVFGFVEERRCGETMIPVVDPPQLMWDLIELGGDDRHEAAGRLREWFLRSRSTP